MSHRHSTNHHGHDHNRSSEHHHRRSSDHHEGRKSHDSGRRSSADEGAVYRYSLNSQGQEKRNSIPLPPLQLHLPMPLAPDIVQARNGPRLEEINQLEVDYPDHHHQRWYFFWPPGQGNTKGTYPGPPQMPMGSQPLNRYPYPPTQGFDKQVQKFEMLESIDTQTGRFSDARNAPIDPTGGPQGRAMRNSFQGGGGIEPQSSPQRNLSYGSIGETAVMLDPKTCSRCGIGKLRKKVTTAGYVAAILLFPIGTYACLAKKWFVELRCTYCGQEPRQVNRRWC